MRMALEAKPPIPPPPLKLGPVYCGNAQCGPTWSKRVSGVMFCCVFGLVRSNVVAMWPVKAVVFQFGPCYGEGRTP